MKVLKLHIENIRGIRKIDLDLGGDNLVIFGPNGTGKSAVVDALDFLFTGRISRLSGEGTSGITLKSHGPHIDSKPEDTVVEAEIQIPDSPDVYKIKRSLSKPDRLEVLDGNNLALREPMEVASRGQHVLSRREILKYIAAKRGDRAKEIQALLNLRKIEQVRELFVKVETDATRIHGAAKIQLDSATQSLCVKLSLDQFSKEAAIEQINQHRFILKGHPIEKLDPDKVKEGLNPPAEPYKAAGINPNLIKNEITACLKILTEESEKVIASEKALLAELDRLRSDEALQKELKSLTLLQYGISMLDDSGRCPLCETEWNPDELRSKLEKRLLSAQQAKGLQDNIKSSVQFIKDRYLDLKNRLSEIAKALDALELPKIRFDFDKSVKDIVIYCNQLSDPVNNFGEIRQWSSEQFVFSAERFADKFQEIEQRIETEAKKYSPELIAWDTLTELKGALETYEKAQKEYEKAKGLLERATLLRSNYENSRDRMLNNLYKNIETDFVAFYKSLHGDDEQQFEAVLESRGPELVLEVDFYGRGKFPPIALHSEGHQDSMGLCLYLALMKLLTQGKVLLTVLDDVVMSIDSDHRKAFSRLLASQFPDRQFLITTHNKTWARQLQTDGIAKKKNMIEFRRWNVNTGPVFEGESYSWREIYGLINDNRISDASAKLREHSEFYFDQVCCSLGAKTVHRLDDRFELGDLLPPAIEQYKTLLRKAKSSANSWGHKDQVEKLSEIESIANETIKRSQVEQWGVNPNIHYSRWADFSKNDFLPIAEAFQNLFELFICNKCGGVMFVTSANGEKDSLRCGCGAVNWNLVPKKL